MSKQYYGGQAVIEGVMMRGRKSMAVAVRDPQGKFLGTMEVTQNATALRKLQGERRLLDEVKPDEG